MKRLKILAAIFLYISITSLIVAVHANWHGMDTLFGYTKEVAGMKYGTCYITSVVFLIWSVLVGPTALFGYIGTLLKK